ncbi:DEAD/DEAH box helicase [Paenibacillus glycanilyticus]|uniref:DNA 3'-5' helicase n=1 Tax=Paenibacillus glycanilyticus TaxID=126569 RepID=A0ABQ6G437_9BACL|nr:DEAD/DEAH box helicase [Paenibacillus glycanilyticus]GLX65734.1 hypothetical protein MU1_00780 [Paenibacillus glycanilyticus]
MDFINILTDHITNLNKTTRNPLLVVFEGFKLSELADIIENKLFKESLEISVESLINKKAELIPQLFQQANSHKWVWCTREEELAVGSELLPLYYEVKYFHNNLYHLTYPALYPFQTDESNIELEFNEESEHELALLSKVYGNIRRIENNWFVTYAEQNEESIPFYTFKLLKEIPIVELENNADVTLELNDSEDEFLKLENRLLLGKHPDHTVRIVFSSEPAEAPYKYYNRLKLIQKLAPSYRIEIVQKEMDRTPERDISPYQKILSRYWGHKSFRNLKMYRNIQSRGREKTTVEIPQSQIIDDIVQEAKKASAGVPYKDIFVTSPTGAGKSVMFQIPAIYLAEQYNLLTIVISPLIGLMTDQVQGLVSRNVEISATINSNITPVERIEIQEKIRNGQVSILYISPETLLSRSDIAQLIGERKVGLFVIDEAHIVTTWGKAFRSDYWYLGTYLSKLRQKMNFPIATFTATAIYGGLEDMYEETRNSLNMITPISYFGYVKRDNLEIRIKKKVDETKKFNEYLTDKNKILLGRLEGYASRGQKTLVYFPTVKSIHDFKQFCSIYGSLVLRQSLSVYFGSLEKEAKQENYLRYKNGDSKVMLATKAFGMGIDIPDILNVYHYAPTGNVCDFVQEIGRAARDLPTGYAYFDYLAKDFVHVQRLHGISTIRKGQLIEVIRKILMIIEQNRGENVRNLLVSADEFRHIFEDGSGRDQQDDIDNKIKTALLIIEKDFLAKLSYSPIVARPRSMFAQEYVMASNSDMKLIYPHYSEYFRVISKFGSGLSERVILTCDLKAIWQDKYSNLSFPEFKYFYYIEDSKVKLPFKGKLTPVLKLELTLKQNNHKAFIMETNQWVEHIGSVFSEFARSRKYFSVSEVALNIKQKTGLTSKYQVDMLAEVILNSMYAYDRLIKKTSNFYNRFMKFDESRQAYHFLNTGYAGFLDWINNETKNLLDSDLANSIASNKYEIFEPKVFGSAQEKRYLYLGLMEAMGLLIYRINGGESPEIYIRVNSRSQLERTVNQASVYQNVILANVRLRHQMSVEMLRYLFDNEVRTDEFWELIEDYFLGRIPEEVERRLALQNNSSR